MLQISKKKFRSLIQGLNINHLPNNKFGHPLMTQISFIDTTLEVTNVGISGSLVLDWVSDLHISDIKGYFSFLICVIVSNTKMSPRPNRSDPYENQNEDVVGTMSSYYALSKFLTLIYVKININNYILRCRVLGVCRHYGDLWDNNWYLVGSKSESREWSIHWSYNYISTCWRGLYFGYRIPNFNMP